MTRFRDPIPPLAERRAQTEVWRPAEVRGRLLAWFRRRARPLPWRMVRSAYAVWVSEVMLQQTQVATVIPYYGRFLRALPTLRALSKAPLERVLELWSGLGYYRRARNLHRAARVVVRRFGGRFPSDLHLARSLPGVGDYTARAVLSIAFDSPLTVIDGNVARVIARLRAIRGDPRSPQFRATIERELTPVLSRRNPGDFNQALMELGQTVCTPAAPNCAACPLRRFCSAYRSGKEEEFPEPRPRRSSVPKYLASALICRLPKGQGSPQVAMVRGMDEGLLSDLWNFPSAFGASQSEAVSQLKKKLWLSTNLGFRMGKPLAEFSHSITYRSISVVVYPAELSAKRLGKPFRWIPLSRIHQIAASKLARKAATALQQDETSIHGQRKAMTVKHPNLEV